MNLKNIDIYKYSLDKELPGGEYWQLLEADNNELKRFFWLPDLFRLLTQIQDNTLKDQLKSKFLSLLDLEKNSFAGYLSTEYFTPDEIKSVFKTALNKRLNNYSGPVRFWIIEDSLFLIQRINDVEWQSTEIYKLFDLLDTLDSEYIPNKQKAISRLIIDIKDSNIRKTLLKRYSKDLSQEYLDLIRIESNPNYIKEKSKQFKDICIGIDPRITIGPEIELNHRTFGREGFDISSQQDIGDYHSTTDATVPNGKEFISPKFHDTPDELSIFCAVCDTLKELGYEAYDINVAGQINIGIDYLDTAESLLQFWELFCNSEELLYHICNPEGSILRQPVYNTSRFKAISGELGTQVISEDISRKEVIRMLSAGTSSTLPGIIHKKNSICLRDGNRFEIRIPNGSEDYQVWIDNIRLFAKMVEVSKEISNVVEGKDVSKNSLKKLELKESLKDESLTLEEKLFILMDLLFDDDKIKQIYVDRFYALEEIIAKTGNKIYKPLHCISDSGFGVVDFQRIYHSQISRSEDGSLKLPTINQHSRFQDFSYDYH